MKSLIRFEDTYGMTDVFMGRWKLPFLDISRISERMIKIDDNLYVDFGLGSGWPLIGDDEAYSIMELGIERIIFVYDMDNESGIKKEILSHHALKNYIDNHRKIFENLRYNVELVYIPVVYAAETILLYQDIPESSGINIMQLVNTVDTNAMQLYILACFLNYRNFKHAKRVREYIDPDRLWERLEQVKDGDGNEVLRKWIAMGCQPLDNNLFCGKEALQHLKRIQKIFEQNIQDASVANDDIDVKGHMVCRNKRPKPLLERI